jgi:hypothetical protein
MQPLPLSSDSNFLYAISVGIFAAFVLLTTGLAHSSFRMVKRKGPREKPSTFWASLKFEVLGSGAKAFARMVLWTVFSLLSIWAMATILFDEGFIEIGFDEQSVEINYRLRSESVIIPWNKVGDIQLVERTSRRYKTNWRINVIATNGETYKSVTCSGWDKSTVELYKAAASQLREEWKSSNDD